MYRFFVSKNQMLQAPVVIEGEDYNHIHSVLRLKRGEEVLLCAEDDKEYLCSIEGYNEEQQQVLLRVVDIFGNNRELPARMVLFQGLPKGDKMEWIIQKAVELGVSEIVPVSMKRCVVKLDEKKAGKKVERYNSIALSAAKQSKRGKIPTVTSVMSMKEAMAYGKELEMVLVPYELAGGMEISKKRLHEAAGKSSIGIFIGPEGGFDPEEVTMIESLGGYQISLGHRILRTETAGMVVLSLLMFDMENDENDGGKIDGSLL